MANFTENFQAIPPVVLQKAGPVVGKVLVDYIASAALKAVIDQLLEKANAPDANGDGIPDIDPLDENYACLLQSAYQSFVLADMSKAIREHAVATAGGASAIQESILSLESRIGNLINQLAYQFPNVDWVIQNEKNKSAEARQNCDLLLIRLADCTEALTGKAVPEIDADTIEFPTSPPIPERVGFVTVEDYDAIPNDGGGNGGGGN